MHWQSPFPVYFLSATFKIKTAHLLSPPNFFLTLIVNDIFFLLVVYLSLKAINAGLVYYDEDKHGLLCVKF